MALNGGTRERFGSRAGFVMAAVGSAIGLGSNNSSGAYLIVAPIKIEGGSGGRVRFFYGGPVVGVPG